MNILLKNIMAVLEDGTVKETDIFIEGNVIKSIGIAMDDFNVERIIDGKNRLAIPGFINAHTHASMSILRSYADDMNLKDWLEQKIWPIENKMNRNDVYWGAMLANLEMIRTGTTTFADMYGQMDKVAEATIEAGLRGVLSQGIIAVAPNGEENFKSGENLYKEFNNAADGRIKVMFGPHAPYTCPPKFLSRVAEKAKEYGAEIHIHLAETVEEVDNLLKEYGKTPFEIMEETGILDCGVLAAHCVYANEKDIDLLAKYNVRVAHNPVSNMKLASGIAPVPKMLEKGIIVALGTDGVSSNNNLDMVKELRMAALLHKVNGLNPLAVNATEALKMATINGAKAVGLERLGMIREGYLADITIFNLEDIEWQPRNDLISLLVYSANSYSVETVIVNGKILMEKKEFLTLDKERILYEINKCAQRLVK